MCGLIFCEGSTKQVNDLGGWVVRCSVCGIERLLKLSYHIGDFKQLYHWCPVCRRNTYHDIVSRVAP